MSGPIPQPGATAPTGPQTGGAVAVAPRRKSRYSLLTRRDKVVLSLMVGIPTFLCLFFIWMPTLISFGLSFTNWRGVGEITGANFVGLKNYDQLFTALNLGVGSAMSVLIFIAVALIAFTFIKGFGAAAPGQDPAGR